MARERTEEGLVAARARYNGKLPVRGPAITGDQIKTAKDAAVARRHERGEGGRGDRGVPRATLYRHVPDITSLRAADRAGRRLRRARSAAVRNPAIIASRHRSGRVAVKIT